MTIGIVWVAFFAVRAAGVVLTDNNVHLAAHTFGNEGRKLFATAVRRKVVDRDGLPIYIAQFVQARKNPSNRLDRTTWIEHEIKKAEPRHILGRLRARSERPRCSASEQGDEFPSPHRLPQRPRAFPKLVSAPGN